MSDFIPRPSDKHLLTWEPENLHVAEGLIYWLRKVWQERPDVVVTNFTAEYPHYAPGITSDAFSTAWGSILQANPTRRMDLEIIHVVDGKRRKVQIGGVIMDTITESWE